MALSSIKTANANYQNNDNLVGQRDLERRNAEHAIMTKTGLSPDENHDRKVQEDNELIFIGNQDDLKVYTFKGKFREDGSHLGQNFDMIL